MASKAKPAKKTLVQLGDGGSPETFTTIAEVVSFNGALSEEAGEIDVTSQDSDAREYTSDALPDAPDGAIEVLFVGSNAQQQALRALVAAGTARNFKTVLNDHSTTKTTFSFTAIVKGFDGPTVNTGEAYRATITIKRTGAVNVDQYAPN